MRLLIVGLVLVLAGHARAFEPISIADGIEHIEITKLGDLFQQRGDRFGVEAAADTSGVSGGRVEFRSATPGKNANWFVFALRNSTSQQIERWIIADRYTIVGSGFMLPELDGRRIESVGRSYGFTPERIQNDRTDIFRLLIEPGQTVTYGVELASARLPRIFLTTPLAYEKRERDRALFAGIMLGIVGVIGIALTSVFVANHRAIFPAAALVAWSVLAYLCVEFGFWNKLFLVRADDNAVYRAASEAATAASIVIFLYTFLRAGQWNGFLRALFGIWILGQCALVAGAVLEPRLVAMSARLSFAVIALLGTLAITALALRGQDRALSLVPIWLLLLVWIFGAAMGVSGRLAGDVVVPGLVAGLVIIVILLGFTVTQFAFRSSGQTRDLASLELNSMAQAVEGAGNAVWEWNARRDEIKVSPFVEDGLGLPEGELSRRVEDFAQYLHPADRDRFNLLLWSVKEKNGGPLRLDFRLRKADGTYRWFELEAASVPHSDHRTLKCAGLLRDVTEVKQAQERLLHDAVHDSLTSLPNRELFLDRLQVAIQRAREAGGDQPVVLFIDLDRFKSVNSSFGIIVADSMLLTISRRLKRHLTSQDTLARIGGDQFAILLAKALPPQELALLAERIRRAIRSPMKISGKDVVLTCSIGIAAWDGKQEGHHQLLSEAEAAMYRAKRAGADRIEVFTPQMRDQRDDRVEIETDLRRALDRRQIRVYYQPIIRFPSEELAGFEALVRWQHPRHGLLNPVEFVPIAEQSDLIARLGAQVLERATADVARWLKELPRPEAPLFVSVNVSSRQLFRQDFVTEIRHIIGREQAPKGSLRLEITESLVMENPEKAAEILSWLKQSGASLAIDDFGTGYSSLAYLHRLPFDTIKIDRSLLRSGPIDQRGPLIVKSIVTLAHELGKEVVAEGVETQEDVVFLRAIGCEYGQGYYYGHPMTDKEVIELLRTIRRENKRDKGWFSSRRRKKAASAETGPVVTDEAVESPRARVRPQPGPSAPPPPEPPLADVAAPDAWHGPEVEPPAPPAAPYPLPAEAHPFADTGGMPEPRLPGFEAMAAHEPMPPDDADLPPPRVPPVASEALEDMARMPPPEAQPRPELPPLAHGPTPPEHINGADPAPPAGNSVRALQFPPRGMAANGASPEPGEEASDEFGLEAREPPRPALPPGAGPSPSLTKPEA